MCPILRQPLSHKQADKRVVSLFDLNLDCVQFILEHMPAIDLFSLSNTSSTLFHLVKKTLQQKLPNKKMIFQYPYHSFDGKNFEQMDYETEASITMRALPKHVNIPWILKHFGHLISSIEITHGPNSPEKVTKKLVYMINFYCASTLQRFQITNFVADIFDTIRKPFEKVVELSLNGDFENVGNLNFLFPSARILSLSAFTISHLRTFGLKMPHVEHLSIADQYDYVSDEMKSIVNNHRQVRSLKTEWASLKLLQYVSNTLTSLDSLTIDRIEHNDEDELIHFDRLKRFVLTGYIETMPTNIVLRDVEEFEVSNLGNSDNLIDFILQYKAKLKKLYLMVQLTDDELFQLADANLNVTEIKFEMTQDNDIRDVIYLIKCCWRLTNLQIFIQAKAFRQSVFEMLQKQVTWKWMILMNDSHLSLISKSDFTVYPPESVHN